MAISAIGALGRVPVSGSDDTYVTCFVIAAIDYPLGGIPEFFVTGLAGGLGLNRQLVLPDVSYVSSSPFMLALSGFGNDPMGALESIRTNLPAEWGSMWFAVGVKFTTYQVLETKAVLFVKRDDNFTIGILGMSSLSLPSKEFGIGYIELAFLAYYDSGENVLWVEAQLTDASYLFDKNCRLTGGFALVTWFSRGEFVLSLGGYHPKFKAPSHYPVVPRLGFNWKPISKLTVKGGAYFTVCTSAVMIGGGLEATFKAGSLSASFKAGVDVLIVFDPFFYSFRVYIGVSVRLKTWLGTLKASLGADLEIEGPTMRGKAKIEVAFISFTVKFGDWGCPEFNAVPFKTFLTKHVLQLPEDKHGENISSEHQEMFLSAMMPEGIIRSEDGEEQAGNASDPWLTLPEFEIVFDHIFPASSHTITFGAAAKPLDSRWRLPELKPFSGIKIAPCGVDSGINVSVDFSLIPIGGSANIREESGISSVTRGRHFPETIWTCTMENGRPKAKKSPSSSQPFFMSGASFLFRAKSIPNDWRNTVEMEQVKPCDFIHNLPLAKKTLGTISIDSISDSIGSSFDWSSEGIGMVGDTKISVEHLEFMFEKDVERAKLNHEILKNAANNHDISKKIEKEILRPKTRLVRSLQDEVKYSKMQSRGDLPSGVIR